MKFLETQIPGVFEIHVEQHFDDRGFFARTWCQSEFEEHRLNPRLVQCSISFNTRKGTVRGMHYQAAPYEETKIVRCTRGAIYDVVIDLRRDSSAFKKWVGVKLTAGNHNMLYVPERCAHGFVTLEDNCEVAYQMSEVHNPESARGVRWNDPAFRIAWPEQINVMSDRDRSYPDFE